MGRTAYYWQRWTKFGYQADLAWSASLRPSADLQINLDIDHFCMENDMIGFLALLEASHESAGCFEAAQQRVVLNWAATKLSSSRNNECSWSN